MELMSKSKKDAKSLFVQRKMRTFEPMKMKHIFLISLMSMITLWANGQNDQTEKGQKSKFAGMRMEVAESETDNGEYSIFTLEDEDGHFGYYLSLGRLTSVLGADEILGMEIKNVSETTICIGETADKALVALNDILELFDKDVDFTTEFVGRSVTKSGQLGEPNTSLCIVKKKPFGGKRLMFVFDRGKHEAHAYLNKSTVKELRTGLKIDKKLHPKHHR